MNQLFNTLAKPETYQHKKTGRIVHVEERSETHVAFRQSGYLSLTPMSKEAFKQAYRRSK